MYVWFYLQFAIRRFHRFIRPPILLYSQMTLLRRPMFIDERRCTIWLSLYSEYEFPVRIVSDLQFVPSLWIALHRYMVPHSNPRWVASMRIPLDDPGRIQVWSMPSPHISGRDHCCVCCAPPWFFTAYSGPCFYRSYSDLIVVVVATDSDSSNLIFVQILLNSRRFTLPFAHILLSNFLHAHYTPSLHAHATRAVPNAIDKTVTCLVSPILTPGYLHRRFRAHMRHFACVWPLKSCAQSTTTGAKFMCVLLTIPGFSSHNRLRQ